MYIQAIPLFLKSDNDAFRYMNDNLAELDALTGASLQLVLPREVERGDAPGLLGLFTPRSTTPQFPGLLRSDLPCFWVADGGGNHALIRMPAGGDGIARCIRAMTDAADAGRDAAGVKAWVQDRLSADAADRNPAVRATADLLRSLMEDLSMNKSTERLLAFASGVVFVGAILVLAVVFPEPSRFQYQVFRIVLALAAAGFVAMTPGFLEVTISKFLRAGGALAVFAVVYFYNPASLVAEGGPPAASPPAASLPGAATPAPAATQAH